jgi:hypothetical protein
MKTGYSWGGAEGCGQKAAMFIVMVICGIATIGAVLL